MRSFNGNLYMLDAVAGQVWRYVPKGDGYPDKPEAYFDPVPPIAAKGLELLIDGSVYVITADGQIAKYLGGKPESFQISGFSSPLSPVLAAAVDVNQADSSLYVAVPGGLLQDSGQMASLCGSSAWLVRLSPQLRVSSSTSKKRSGVCDQRRETVHCRAAAASVNV